MRFHARRRTLSAIKHVLQITLMQFNEGQQAGLHDTFLGADYFSLAQVFGCCSAVVCMIADVLWLALVTCSHYAAQLRVLGFGPCALLAR